MKKLVVFCFIPLGIETMLTGCGQTGRTITNNQRFDRCTIYANALPSAERGAEQRLSDPMDAASGSVFSQNASMWTETAGNEEGTGRNSTSVPVDIDVPLNQNKATGGGITTGAAIGALADKAIGALGGGDGNSTPAAGGGGSAREDARPPDCPDGNCGDSCADGSCTIP